jgi:8-oxo-dGTP pyrophosphatase MutT (NUDIX family)
VELLGLGPARVVPDAGEEPVEIVDEDDRVVDVVPRRVMRERGLRHRCTYVFVLDVSSRLYVHRRTATKDVYPGFYDVTAGGVNAVGETYDDAAAREVEEELGVTARPTHRFTQAYDGPDGRCVGAVYDVVWDGPIVWQPTEVVWGEFLELDRVDELIEREPFCPDSLEMFKIWRGRFASSV